MSQSPQATNRKLDEKLDVVVEKVTRIEERLSSHYLIDDQKEKNINQKFDIHEKRIKDLESNQKWVVFAILGIILNAMMQLILH